MAQLAHAVNSKGLSISPAGGWDLGPFGSWATFEMNLSLVLFFFWQRCCWCATCDTVTIGIADFSDLFTGNIYTFVSTNTNCHNGNYLFKS